MSIGGTIGKVEELANTLQVCFDSGAKKYYYLCHQLVIFQMFQVICFLNLIYHFIIIQKMQYIKHWELNNKYVLKILKM